MPSTADHLAEQIVDGNPNMQKIELSTCKTPGRASWAESMFEQLVLVRLQTGLGIWKDTRTVYFPYTLGHLSQIADFVISFFPYKSLPWDEQLKNFVSYWTCFIVSTKECQAASLRRWLRNHLWSVLMQKSQEFLICLHKYKRFSSCQHFFFFFAHLSDKVSTLERFQRKMIQGLKRLSYEESLKELGLVSTEKRKGDLITMFQHLKSGLKAFLGVTWKRDGAMGEICSWNYSSCTQVEYFSQ